uniref:Putative ovule protein n=1 Tax=Solanum chacoense TaxID=4108 RepID=A0A0V0GUD8_SOLCH
MWICFCLLKVLWQWYFSSAFYIFVYKVEAPCMKFMTETLVRCIKDFPYAHSISYFDACVIAMLKCESSSFNCFYLAYWLDQNV